MGVSLELTEYKSSTAVPWVLLRWWFWLVGVFDKPTDCHARSAANREARRACSRFCVFPILWRVFRIMRSLGSRRRRSRCGARWTAEREEATEDALTPPPILVGTEGGWETDGAAGPEEEEGARLLIFGVCPF